MKKITFISLCLIIFFSAFAKEYHVSKKGNDSNPGNRNAPFFTIQAAANVVFPGDLIIVHAGVYREWINPIRGGSSDVNRIIFTAAHGDRVEIKGSEEIKGWKKIKDGVWKVVINNEIFGNYNPYQDSIFGDWFWDKGRIHHTGDVFLNEKSLFEKENIDQVFHPVAAENTLDLNGSLYTWYCESNDEYTTIWANFHDCNPNKEQVEISVRNTCFYPESPGVNYITLKGFYISQAATQWGAPTAEQVGMVATHWNKGWIIEDNVISNSKCSGITLGKDRSTGHNVWSADKTIDGSIHYIETTFKALRNGWNKERIGSHIVRNNTIFDCEQTGICGSMGAAFSTIENNHIYNIWIKRQFTGAEIGGIKFHAAIDATIKGNRIHNAGRGLWLDWMTQGTRVAGNLFYNNDLEDLFLEVNHGPFVVDNNILLSKSAIRNQSQGGAFIHNLIGGTVHMWSEPQRFTPYHLPHSTEVAGLSTIYSGDDRYYNNIFVGNGGATDLKFKHGLEVYNNAKLPVFISGNMYYFGANSSGNDDVYFESQTYSPGIKLEEHRDGVFLEMLLDEEFFKLNCKPISTAELGKAKIPNQKFENPDGSILSIEEDYFGNKRNATSLKAGPFEINETGKLNLKVW